MGMVQSHLLQVMASTLAPLESSTYATRVADKLAILNDCHVSKCVHGQYEGFLLEEGLSSHPEFADATYIDMSLVCKPGHPWAGVDVRIQTAKAMKENHYGIHFDQKGGEGGELTFEIGQ